MKVTGIDPACGGTGIANWAPYATIDMRTVKSDPKWMDQHRWDYITNSVMFVAGGPDSLVIIEQPPSFGGSQGGGTTLLNGGLFAVLTEELWRARVPFVVVQPSQIKQYATGMGDAHKREVLAAVREVFHAAPKTQDEADAFVALAMALDYYGRPLCTVGERNREVLYAKHKSGKRKGEPKIHWPSWTLEE